MICYGPLTPAKNAEGLLSLMSKRIWSLVAVEEELRRKRLRRQRRERFLESRVVEYVLDGLLFALGAAFIIGLTFVLSN